MELFAERVERLGRSSAPLALDRRHRGSAPVEPDSADLRELIDELRTDFGAERALAAFAGRPPAVGTRAERRNALRRGKH